MNEPVILRLGIPVLNQDGEEVGTLEKLVFSETERKITELIVRDLASLKRVLMTQVQAISSHSIALACRGALESFPVFDPTEFEEVPTWFFPPGYQIEIGSLVTLKPSDIREMGEAAACSRREFMARSTAVVAGLIGISLLVPIGGYILAAAKSKVSDHWVPLSIPVSQLPVDSPVSHTFRAISVSGWMRVPIERSVWLIRHSSPQDPMSLPEDQKLGLDSKLEKQYSDPLLTVLSPICPHLGCSPQWIENKKLFICPCHHSIYELNGNRISGPAPRPMDTLPVKIGKDGEILIMYEQFKIGIPEKVRLA
ncbi:MAG: QcrA and Rieske domain-containing protein [Leptospirales bacterium]